jgi:hypothetical protein
LDHYSCIASSSNPLQATKAPKISSISTIKPKQYWQPIQFATKMSELVEPALFCQ